MPKTRGRAACNTCRARKQKVGPAKGYTKALECRLQETELALLQLLMSSKEETITKAFHPESKSIARVYHEQLYDQLAEHDSPGGSEKQRALRDQWEQFPLQTASDMKHWTERLKQSGEYQPHNDTQELSEVQHTLGNFFNDNDQSMAIFQSPSSVIEDQPFEESQHQIDPMVQAPNPQPLIESIPSADNIQSSREAEKDGEVSNSASRGMDLPTNFKDSFLW
ncbi:uncharacterized protein QYS62_000050 [Fusarium acuminatum]|uniref:Uncharacterized protein n=1 Tax=Fusarium acuminatum TaxID=5515 RepID=A0ABZ2WGG7_9HYPO